MGSDKPAPDTIRAIWIANANIDRFRTLLADTRHDDGRQKIIMDLLAREEAALKRLSAE
jgi:hypothetical protein